MKDQLRQIRHQPLSSLLKLVSPERKDSVGEDEIERFRTAYWMYYLSLDRLLPEMSLAARWRTGPYWALREGMKYTSYERRLAKRYNLVAKYIELDFINSIIHARIVLDRVAGLSRFFLRGSALPSFTSFAEHRKFFITLTNPYKGHEEYAEYIRSKTDWFEVLKSVRDKFLVHIGPRHHKFWGFPAETWELDLTLLLYGDKTRSPPLQILEFSVPRLAKEIDGFLRWFSAYGVRSFEEADLESGKVRTPEEI